jgi:hypothetical protein
MVSALSPRHIPLFVTGGTARQEGQSAKEESFSNLALNIMVISRIPQNICGQSRTQQDKARSECERKAIPKSHPLYLCPCRRIFYFPERSSR